MIYKRISRISTFTSLRHERSLFVNCMQEILNPIKNPRYIIIRKSKLLKIATQKDYHAVPEIIGSKKELAEFFKNFWEVNVGSCELLFTRTLEGRKLLLEARMKSPVSTTF